MVYSNSSPLLLSKINFRKVFQRNSSQSDVSQKSSMTDSSLEIKSLKNQVETLKTSINKLKLDTENKEMKLAQLAREKEKLSMDLSKIKRSNINLMQQLEDERNFYYKEKEAYCQEMNQFKKLKKSLSNSNLLTQIDCNEEIDKLKKTLEKTLQTNYNLSVKFLRMKETKTYLYNALHKAEEEHRKIVNDFKYKIENLTKELKEILNQKFDAPLSPSNKKYLHLVNQNSSLVYENLCLQMQVDQLNVKLKRNKMQQTKSETNARIQQPDNKDRKSSRRTHSSLTTSASKENDKIVKIYERIKRPGLPTVTILNEREIALKAPSSERKLYLPVVNESKLAVFQVSELQSTESDVGGPKIKKRCRSAPKVIQTTPFKKSAFTNNEIKKLK